MGKNVILIFGSLAAVVATSTLMLSGVLSTSGAKQTEVPAHSESTNPITHLPLDVKTVFSERQKAFDAVGTTYLYMDEQFVDSNNHCDFCVGVAYTPGAHEKATVAFKRSVPLELTQAIILTFDLRGDTGGEKIMIYALGKATANADDNTNSQDSDGLRGVDFAFSKLVELDTRWRSYDVDITGFDRSSITHAFAFQILKGESDQKQFVYLDSLLFEEQETSHAIKLN